MIGAGVFAVWAPAAAAAGWGLLIGLALAAGVAFANAGSTAQLAVRYPTSGGAYHYGRERLGAWPGFLAGWSFVIGKTASCAAMALTAAAYLVPAGWQKPVAIVAVLVLVGVNVLGARRTARVGAVLVAGVLAVLVVVVAAGVTAAIAGAGVETSAGAGTSSEPAPGGVYGVLQSAALIFFAFAGYARIATLGEEVRRPSSTIPRAIGIAFLVVVVVYTAVGTATLIALGPRRLAASDAPLADVVAVAGWSWAVPLVGIAAGVAALGSLLVLIAGVARTALAMGRDRELPTRLAEVHRASRVPVAAELAVGAAILVLVLVADLRGAIGFSSFGVLLYYLVANAAAFTQPPGERLVPGWLPIVGAVGCVVLALALPLESIVAGGLVLGVGAAARAIAQRLRARRATPPQ